MNEESGNAANVGGTAGEYISSRPYFGMRGFFMVFFAVKQTGKTFPQKKISYYTGGKHDELQSQRD
jgi:hypothetical protein